MDIQTLREKIQSLDPKLHKALKDALTSEYDCVTGKKAEVSPQSKPASNYFEEMYWNIYEDLEARYIDGTIEFIAEHRPDLYQKTNEAEDRLNEVWKACLKGKAGTDEFRKVLVEWYRLHLRGIEIFSKEKGKQEKAEGKTPTLSFEQSA